MNGWTYVIIFVIYFVMLSGLILYCRETKSKSWVTITIIMGVPVILSIINLILAILKQLNALGGFWRILRFCFITPEVQHNLMVTSILMVSCIISIVIIIFFQWMKGKI